MLYTHIFVRTFLITGTAVSPNKKYSAESRIRKCRFQRPIFKENTPTAKTPPASYDIIFVYSRHRGSDYYDVTLFVVEIVRKLLKLCKYEWFVLFLKKNALKIKYILIKLIVFISFLSTQRIVES